MKKFYISTFWGVLILAALLPNVFLSWLNSTMQENKKAKARAEEAAVALIRFQSQENPQERENRLKAEYEQRMREIYNKANEKGRKDFLKGAWNHRSPYFEGTNEDYAWTRAYVAGQKEEEGRQRRHKQNAIRKSNEEYERFGR